MKKIFISIFAILFATNVWAGSTQSNVSGSNTAIEGNYSSESSTTYERVVVLVQLLHQQLIQT